MANGKRSTHAVATQRKVRQVKDSERAEEGSLRSSTSDFELACQKALRRAGDLAPLGRDRIIEDLRIRFDYAGEYVAYIDRIKTIKKVRRLIPDVLAHGPGPEDVQEAIDAASDEDRREIMMDFIEGEQETPQLDYELRGP